MNIDFIELLLAILGTIITVIQVLNEYRNHRIQIKKKKAFQKILIEADQWIDQRNNMLVLWGELIKNPQGTSLENYLNEIPNFLLPIRGIYVRLLLENEPSLSIGLDRYINIFRENIMKVEWLREKIIKELNVAVPSSNQSEIINIANQLQPCITTLYNYTQEPQYKFNENIEEQLKTEGLIK